MASILNILASCLQLSLVPARQRSGTGATSGTGVDISNLEGMALVLLDSKFESGTATTLAVVLEESDTVGGTYTPVANGAFTVQGTADLIQKLAIEIGAGKKFLRATGTAAGTSPVYTWSVQVVGVKKY